MFGLMRIAWHLRRILSWFSRPVTLGVKGIVIDKEERVLLVKHTYLPGWHLPGGGVARGEDILQAIKRELLEEAGIVCLEDPKPLPGLLYGITDFKHDHVMVFLVRKFERKLEFQKGIEISDVGFFKRSELPIDTSPATHRRLEHLNDLDQVKFRW
ncbi:MAG: NUDIX domain-containing protein [Bdellovibrionales bacterium]|nr:NUDIX domain-containing protein [Bdellovibrionales bacterium]